MWGNIVNKPSRWATQLKQWNELSDAVSAEQLKQSGMDKLKPAASADASFKRLRPFLKVRRARGVLAKIAKKLA